MSYRKIGLHEDYGDGSDGYFPEKQNLVVLRENTLRAIASITDNMIIIS